MRSLSKVLGLVLLLILSTGLLFAQFAGGTGTAQDPYQVATAEHLNNVRNYSSAHFIQTADLDLGVAPWNQGEGWVPIGDYYNYNFTGYYNGDGHIVENLYINRPNTNYQALLGSISGGSINNLGLSNISVSGGDYYTGGLLGYSDSGTITNCSSSGTVSGGDYTGGLLGYNSGGTITNCYSSGTVSGGDYTGGLLGYNQYGTISNCYSSGTVSGMYYTGGLLGLNFGTITNCYSSGTVSGVGCTGGLLGYHYSGTITNCYSSSTVNGGDHTGGLIGYNYYNGGTYTNSYWDIQSSGQTYSAGGEGRFTAEMVFPSSPNTYVGWDWQIWKPDISHAVNSGYPYLRKPNEVASQAPEPAVALNPVHQAQSVLPSVVLNWNFTFSPENADIPTGFRLYLGTNNPPSNIVNGDDLGYTYNYDPSPDLNPNTSYYWQVVPYNQVGEAQSCPVWSFTTYNPAMSISYPVGGELWLSGSTRSISWPEENIAPNLKLYISFNNGSQWILISDADGTKGFYHYQVPSTNSSQCRIKVENALNSDEFAISNSFTISTSNSQAKVLLSYPSATDIHLKAGDTVNITWTRQNVTAVALDWSADDGNTWVTIATGLNANSYLWTIADAPGRAHRLRVRSELNAEVLDISDNSLTISKVQVLVPNGGEILTGDYSGYAKTFITWSAPGAANVKIEYSANGGSAWTTVNASVNAAYGSYYWAIPGTPTVNGRIRISNVENTAINDISDASFSIHNPIKLVNANGGGFITNQSLFNIRWKMQDIASGSNIFWEYSANNSNWTRINSTAVAVSSESMMWFVNTGLSNTMWLRAVEYGTLRIVGKSEQPFKVTDKNLILYEPNGGEDYPALSSQNISWDHGGLTNLNLYYTYDDGDSWNLIASNIPASNLSYTWQVPDTPSVNCRIKLQDQTHSYMVLESDTNFSISPLQVINPTVDFAADLHSGDIPLAVQFTETINPGVGSVSSRLWDFGDGNTSGLSNPLHTYTAAGTYTVSLTVTNDFGGSATETKTDYIIALPKTPRIELLSASTLNYGTVYLGDSSAPQAIQVKNIGTAPLNIASVSYHLTSNQFALSETTLPIVVPVNGTATLTVVFTPSTNGAVSDSIYILSDASNLPSLAIKLSGTGEYVPPAMVDGVEVNIVGNDAIITWEAVTETIYGTPLVPDLYIVLYNETPYEDDNYYYYLISSTTLFATHYDVARFRDAMFYRVVAVKFYRDGESDILAAFKDSGKKISWSEVKNRLSQVRKP